jgi:hypothetical protein
VQLVVVAFEGATEGAAAVVFGGSTGAYTLALVGAAAAVDGAALETDGETGKEGSYPSTETVVIGAAWLVLGVAAVAVVTDGAAAKLVGLAGA